MLNLDWLTPDIHSRYLANGLTRYALNEITCSLLAVLKAEQDFVAQWREAHAVIAEYEEGTVIPVYPENLKAYAEDLYSIWQNAPAGVGSGLGKGREAFPVAKWNTKTKQFNRLTEKLLALTYEGQATKFLYPNNGR